MLYAGEIIWQGPVAEVDTTDNPYVQQFVHGRAEGPIRMPVRQE
jgi:phospholipid/cholesterol/gamma-HCH transport system ATP-binding protein